MDARATQTKATTTTNSPSFASDRRRLRRQWFSGARPLWPLPSPRAASSLVLLAVLLISASGASARTPGAARPWMPKRPEGTATVATALGGRVLPAPATNPTGLLLGRLRGGSSLGGSSSGRRPFSVRPAPRPRGNPFGNSRDRAPGSVRNPGLEPQEQSYGDEQEEDVKEVIDAFLTRDSRNSFIARVYGILSVQLGFTALVCLLFGTYPPLTNIYVLDSLTGRASPFVLVPLAGVFLSTIAWFRVAASPRARQKSPNKWWWLAIFTAGEAVSIGALSSLYKLRSVVTAMGATALATVTVSVYTIAQKNSKYDLSQWGATLSSWATILLVYLMLGLAQEVGWLPRGFLPFSHVLCSVFSTCLFSLFLAYHTKLIVGGKHAKYRMNEKDYVFGAMTLYVDIVNIFLNILALIGEERER